MSLKFPADCLERYEPLEVIGTGGFGVVYRARDLRLERHVAIKLLHEETLRQPGQLERFLQEARSTYQISHKNIIKLLDFGFSAGAPWIVYELIEGHSLAGELSRGPLEIDRALGAIHDVALGLSASHSMGILHRDIKPENILVTEDAFKIIDFGIAKWISGSGVRTEHGFVLGTPAYMAPEQVLGQPPSESFDIYSLGISLFELLAGRVPFISENPTLVIKQHLDGVMPRPSEFNPAIPAVVDELVLRIAATRVNDRIPTAAAVALEIERLRELLTSRRPASAPAAATIQVNAPTPGSATGISPHGKATRSLPPPREDADSRGLHAVVNPTPGSLAWPRNLSMGLFSILAVGLVGILVYPLSRQPIPGTPIQTVETVPSLAPIRDIDLIRKEASTIRDEADEIHRDIIHKKNDGIVAILDNRGGVINDEDIMLRTGNYFDHISALATEIEKAGIDDPIWMYIRGAIHRGLDIVRRVNPILHDDKSLTLPRKKLRDAMKQLSAVLESGPATPNREICRLDSRQIFLQFLTNSIKPRVIQGRIVDLEKTLEIATTLEGDWWTGPDGRLFVLRTHGSIADLSRESLGAMKFEPTDDRYLKHMTDYISLCASILDCCLRDLSGYDTRFNLRRMIKNVVEMLSADYAPRGLKLQGVAIGKRILEVTKPDTFREGDWEARDLLEQLPALIERQERLN